MKKKFFQCRRFRDWLELELMNENLDFNNSPILFNLTTEFLKKYDYPHLMIDLKRLLNLNSPEIGVLLHLTNLLQTNDRLLMLICDNPVLCEIFRITRLETIFKTFPSRDEALSYLACRFPLEYSSEPIEIFH